MGGCYSDYSYSRSYCQPAPAPQPVKKQRKPANPQWRKSMKDFAEKKELQDLVVASRDFFRNRRKGFIPRLAEACGVEKVEDMPKEFKEWEYEVKFNIEPEGRGGEPSVVQYLDAFDFPIGSNSRFVKDPVHNFAEGFNHFVGSDREERFVVIEKMGKKYLKEKGEVTPLSLGIPGEEIVIKRTEERHETSMDEILKKMRDMSGGAEYVGRIRKEKGDDFVLDVSDGRIYSFTVTRAHRRKADEGKESGIQRQLELEYAGFIPGFKGFKRDSEEQIVGGMVDLAKYVFLMHHRAPVGDGWRMNLSLTGERKYDFVSADLENRILSLPFKRLELLARN